MLIRRVILMSLLGLTCGSASAEWTLVAELDDMKTYINLDTIKRDGDTVKVWVLSDYKKVKSYEKKKFLSGSAQNEFNCVDDTVITKTLYFYSKNMARGDVVYSSNVYELPTPIPPDSLGERLLSVACGRQ